LVGERKQKTFRVLKRGKQVGKRRLRGKTKRVLNPIEGERRRGPFVGAEEGD